MTHRVMGHQVPRRRLVVEPLRKRDGPGPVRSRGRSTGGGRIVASTLNRKTNRRARGSIPGSQPPPAPPRSRPSPPRRRAPRAESIARRRARWRRAIQRVQTALVRRSFADSSDADAHRSSDGRSSSAEPRDQFERASDVDVAFVLRDAVVVAVVVVVRAGRRFPVARDAASRASLFDGAFEVRPELRPASSRRDVPTPVRDARDGSPTPPTTTSAVVTHAGATRNATPTNSKTNARATPGYAHLCAARHARRIAGRARPPTPAAGRANEGRVRSRPGTTSRRARNPSRRPTRPPARRVPTVRARGAPRTRPARPSTARTPAGSRAVAFGSSASAGG